MQSILTACHSNKHCDNWFHNKSTQELLRNIIQQEQIENTDQEIRVIDNYIENRLKITPALKGYYVHRLLVNCIAMWASPHYALDVFKLLDDIATEERKGLEHKINEQQPRMVPANKAKHYKYLIWREELDDDSSILHLIRRNKRTFSGLDKNVRDDKSKWFIYRENLPISMSVNDCVKDLIRKALPGSDYHIGFCTIEILNVHLNRIKEMIEDYLDTYQE